MTIERKKYEAIMQDFRDEVRSHPNADFTPFVQRLMEISAAELRAREQLGEQRVINSLLLDLFEGDYRALNGQIAKRIFANAAPGAAPVMAKIEASERGRVFLRLCGLLSLHTREDFDGVIAMCEELKASDEK